MKKEPSVVVELKCWRVFQQKTNVTISRRNQWPYDQSSEILWIEWHWNAQLSHGESLDKKKKQKTIELHYGVCIFLGALWPSATLGWKRIERRMSTQLSRSRRLFHRRERKFVIIKEPWKKKILWKRKSAKDPLEKTTKKLNAINDFFSWMESSDGTKKFNGALKSTGIGTKKKQTKQKTIATVDGSPRTSSIQSTTD